MTTDHESAGGPERHLSERRELKTAFELAINAMDLADALDQGNKPLTKEEFFCIDDPRILASARIPGRFALSYRHFSQIVLVFNTLASPQSETTSFSCDLVYCDDDRPSNEQHPMDAPLDVVTIGSKPLDPKVFTATYTAHEKSPEPIGTASTVEVSDLLASILHPMSMPEVSDYSEPGDPDTLQAIRDTLRERGLNEAPSDGLPLYTSRSKEKVYFSESHDTPGATTITYSEDKIIGIELRTPLEDEVAIVDGVLTARIIDLVMTIELRGGTRGISFCLSPGTDGPSVDYNPKKADIKLLKRFIREATPTSAAPLLLGSISDSELASLVGDEGVEAETSLEDLDQDGFDATDPGA